MTAADPANPTHLGFPQAYQARLRDVYLRILLLGTAVTALSAYTEWDRNPVISQLDAGQALLLLAGWIALLAKPQRVLIVLRVLLSALFAGQLIGFVGACQTLPAELLPIHSEKALFGLAVLLISVQTFHPPHNALLVASGMWLLTAATVGLLLWIGTDTEGLFFPGLRLVLGSGIILLLSKVFSSLYALQSRLHLEHEILRREALTDRLTNLPNRRAFERTLERECALAERQKQPLSLALVDIDSFKEINDRWGHEKGDQVLVKLTEVLQASARASDYAARWAGDEFMVIFPNTGCSDALDVAERIRSAVEALGLTPESLTVTIGVAELQTRDTPSGLTKRADHALYTAKRQGKNQVEAGMQFTHRVAGRARKA